LRSLIGHKAPNQETAELERVVDALMHPFSLLGCCSHWRDSAYDHSPRQACPELARRQISASVPLRVRMATSSGLTQLQMTELTLYHNPRCSKSRSALELLETRGLTPAIVRYLETPPTAAQLRALLDKLGLSARQLLRTGEDEYKSLALANSELSEAELIEAMVEHPRLIERPILVAGDKAIVGRPPERVLEILP